MNRINNGNAVVGDYLVRRYMNGRPERIVEIHAEGVSDNGKKYVCGYTDYFGSYPNSSLSFSTNEDDDLHEVYRD